MKRWSVQKAQDWYAQKKWTVGFNFLPKTAVNSTEMWQEESFDLPEIRRELKLAADTGFHSCRVFLSYIVWQQEGEKLVRRFGLFLEEAAALGLTVAPILFDDCAFAGKEPYYGPQSNPVPGVHNSGWTPSPGFIAADDPACRESLRAYVQAFVGDYRDSKTILFWDLYNEPGNSGRLEKCLPLLRCAFAWARECEPTQPLTSGAWCFEAFEEELAACSDVMSFHCYGDPVATERHILEQSAHGRPVFCTEWLHRGAGSKMQTHLALFKKYKVGIYQWGLVLGKTQTNLSWDTMKGEPEPRPALWQHDLFWADYRPYDPEETALITAMTKGE